MSEAEMNAGFHNLAALQSRDEKYSTSIAACVFFNALILNDVVARLDHIAGRIKVNEGKQKKQQATTEALKATIAEPLTSCTTRTSPVTPSCAASSMS